MDNFNEKNKKYLIGFVAVISVLIVIPFFIPVRTYLDQAAQMAGEKIGAPVSIGSGRLALLPTPRVVARDIAVGRQQEIKVAEITVIPALNSLFSETKVIEISISEPIIAKPALDIISAYTSKKNRGR